MDHSSIPSNTDLLVALVAQLVREQAGAASGGPAKAAAGGAAKKKKNKSVQDGKIGQEEEGEEEEGGEVVVRGAVLVFLPGVGEIRDAVDAMLADPSGLLGDSSKTVLFALNHCLP